ncbi:nucleoside deaminase [Sphingomicrobium sediminis]|uniref:tRNA-specific adenosine deaminase n=1 Tax=Sphingomicrobium sediminis TaxID=2950949 RepID=A0A9X2ELT9_9SPHN|nr:nucleoside deaminase [Sphingomicrobium sediminis]MCM8557839.1 nucleoside deaminase [Sphingomicrobium sediminis]
MTRFPLPDPMRRALDLAAAAAEAGEVPVGAVVVDAAGKTIGEGENRMRRNRDPSGHAEIIALRAAAAELGSERLDGCSLWVSLEPCAMCAGAISLARISKLYFAAEDPKGGAVLHGPRLYTQPTCHHRPDIMSGMGEEDAAAQLRDFFAARRT